MPERLLVDRTEAEASRLNGELPIKGVIKRLKDDVELLEEIAMRPGVLDEVKSDAGISTTPEPAGHMAPTALTTPAAKAADESTSFVLTPGEDFTYRTVNVEALWPLINRTHKTERLSEDEKLFRDDIIALHAWHGDDVTRRASPTTQIETPLPRERLQQLMSLPSRTTAPISRSVQQLKTETPSVSLGPAWAVRMPQPRQSGEARLRVTPVRSTTLPSRLPVYKHKVENSDIDTDGVALGGVWRVSETDSRIGNTQVDHFSTVPLPLGSTTKRPTAPFMSNARLRFHHQRHKV
ncbi:MAG: hypothetical protein KVP17_004317 [Porospora cf. gigantea B]|nr:MAG: hypothetical protein KVP17_004317 [Porospora cf. gigantea B]